MNRDKKTGVVYRKWDHGSTRAVFLLVHGLGAYSFRWNLLAHFFLTRGISSYAIDLEGFGATQALKGHVDSFQTYYQDIQSLRGIIEKEHYGKSVFLVGESMGGLIAFALAAAVPHLFDGLICISPAFKSRLKFSLLDYVKIFFFLAFYPKKQFVMPFDASMCTSDEACRKSIEDDPYEHKLASAKLLFNIFLTQSRARFLARKIKMPVLFLVSGCDVIVDSEMAEFIYQKLRINDRQIERYARMRHALSVEREREEVFEDIFKWVDKRIGLKESF